MAGDRLTVMITPSAAGTAWRKALTGRAAQLGWTVADVGPEGAEESASGLFFANHHLALQSGHGPRAVIIDSTAGALEDPSLPAHSEELVMRSVALVEAEIAARAGALVLNAARYHLELPGLGLVERAEGDRYRIHPAASESPLAVFDALPAPAGAWANWDPHWFVYSHGPGSSDGPWIDMTGRMRALVYGPYVHLPAGRWRVDVRFSVDPEKAHAPLLFEWGGGADFCRIMVEIRRRGAYAIHLDRVWPDAASAQMRIWNAHPVFEGQLEFHGCRVTRVADDEPSPPTPTDHIVELGVI